MKNVLSVQSSVVYGYAGNKAAVLPMQLSGIDVWPFYTVQFSNHTQYGMWQGMAMPHGELSAIISGLDDLQKLAQCDAVLSGYLGDKRHCEEVKLAVTTIRQRNPQALYFCDPVMGDPQKGCIVAQGVESFFVDDAIQLADVMGPNLYELGVLTGRQLRSFDEVVEAAQQLVAWGVKKVLVKHLGDCSRDKQAFEMLLVTPEQTLHIARPLYTFAKMPVGVGDLICSVMLASLLNGYEDKQALERTTSVVDAVMRLTKEHDSYELRLIDARHQIMEPQIRYLATVL